MEQLKKFVSGSKTFGGFDFIGCYTMPSGIFYKLYDHYQKTGENHLDVYSDLEFALWEIAKDDDFIHHNHNWCLEMAINVVIARKLSLRSNDEIEKIKSYIHHHDKKYAAFLRSKRNKSLKSKRNKS